MRELNSDSQHYVKSKETHISSKVNQVRQWGLNRITTDYGITGKHYQNIFLTIFSKLCQQTDAWPRCLNMTFTILCINLCGAKGSGHNKQSLLLRRPLSRKLLKLIPWKMQSFRKETSMWHTGLLKDGTTIIRKQQRGQQIAQWNLTLQEEQTLAKQKTNSKERGKIKVM